MAGFSCSSQNDNTLVQHLMESVDAMALTNRQDEVRWRWTRSEVFSVKSLYLFLQDGGVVVKRYDRTWKMRSLLKVKIFVWLVLKNKVLTKDNLMKRGWSGDESCVFCLEDTETVNHLFAVCSGTTAMFEGLLPNKRRYRYCLSVKEIWEATCSKRGVQGDRDLALISATWWVVWLEHNRRIFEKTKRSIGSLLSEIRSLKELWCRSPCSKHG